MQTTHFWHQLHLRRAKVIVLSILLLFGVAESNAQGYFGLTNNSGSDDKRTSYGFFLGMHNASYQLRYTPEFLSDPNNDDIHSIFPKFTPGISLGFIGIYRFHDQVNLIFTPKLGFYEYKVDVNYFDPSSGSSYRSEELVNEATQVELPLVFKYRSMRFNNTRMFFVGGGSYLFNTRPPADLNLDPIVTARNDFTVEAGIGFEIYFKYFKFAPEIRFSHGVNNIYNRDRTPVEIQNSIQSIRRKGISILLNFQ